jgi:predicted dehydrogenase
MSEDGATIRAGLLGFGLAGRVFHGPLISSTPGMRLAAIVTSDPDRAAQASRTYPGASVLATAEQLWAMADRLDLVVVATPNRHHVPLALAALEAGLAVVIDKPMAATAEDGRRVIEAAQNAGRPLTVFQNRRWDGDFLTVRRLVAEGELGTVARFESRFERWRPEIEAGFRELPAPEEAGGVLFDLGAHLIDQAVQLFGPVEAVYAEVDRRRAGAAIDDDAFVALRHTSGTHSHLWMNAGTPRIGPRYRVLGTKAGYTKWGLDVQEDALAAGARPGDPAFGDDAQERYGYLGTEGDVHLVPTERGRYDAFYAGVVLTLRDGSPMPVDPADSVRVLELIEAAHRSAASGETVRTT